MDPSETKGSTVTTLGVCFAREFPAGLVTQAARTLEEGGVDDLWVIEDCFYTSGVTLAAAALSVTDRLAVGLGILPAMSRNAAVTAMEFATLAELAPGRVVAGIGHGVQEWMEQMGARTPAGHQREDTAPDDAGDLEPDGLSLVRRPARHLKQQHRRHRKHQVARRHGANATHHEPILMRLTP